MADCASTGAAAVTLPSTLCKEGICTRQEIYRVQNGSEVEGNSLAYVRSLCLNLLSRLCEPTPPESVQDLEARISSIVPESYRTQFVLKATKAVVAWRRSRSKTSERAVGQRSNAAELIFDGFDQTSAAYGISDKEIVVSMLAAAEFLATELLSKAYESAEAVNCNESCELRGQWYSVEEFDSEECSDVLAVVLSHNLDKALAAHPDLAVLHQSLASTACLPSATIKDGVCMPVEMFRNLQHILGRSKIEDTAMGYLRSFCLNFLSKMCVPTVPESIEVFKERIKAFVPEDLTRLCIIEADNVLKRWDDAAEERVKQAGAHFAPKPNRSSGLHFQGNEETAAAYGLKDMRMAVAFLAVVDYLLSEWLEAAGKICKNAKTESGDGGDGDEFIIILPKHLDGVIASDASLAQLHAYVMMTDSEQDLLIKPAANTGGKL